MKRKKILFGMAHLGFFRNFEQVIARLLDQGVNVHVHLSKEHELIKFSDYLLPTEKGGANLTFSVAKKSDSSSIKIVERIRILRNLIHYSRKEFKKALVLKMRVITLQKSEVLNHKLQFFLTVLFKLMPSFLKKRVDSLLIRLEQRYPPAPEQCEVISDQNPDYVIATPVVNFASKELGLIKAARRKKIPSLLATASWDNLTNKGLIQVQPDKIAVWNQAMAQEAMQLHEIQSDKIWISGAPLFDAWFDRKPSQDRAAFCSKLGFNPDCPIIVYLCSSLSITNKLENTVVKQWKSELDIAEGIAGANILIRPHPMALKTWRGLASDNNADIAEYEGARIWPYHARHPTSNCGSSDFFDTLYHADAVVGLNTSAMIEAAILGKPVLTFLNHPASVTQTKNLHFEHLKNSGFLFVAENYQQHFNQLGSVLRSSESVKPACEKFVNEFIRPCGKELSASKLLAQMIIDDMEDCHV